MRDGGHPGAPGGEFRSAGGGLEHHQVGLEPGEHRFQVCEEAPRQHRAERRGPDRGQLLRRQLAEFGAEQVPGGLRTRFADRRSGVDRFETRGAQRIVHDPAGRESDLVALLAGGDGQRQQRMNMPVRGERGEQDAHSAQLSRPRPRTRAVFGEAFGINAVRL